jgi:hypothetical protein
VGRDWSIELTVAKFVEDDGNLFSVLLGEDVVEKGGLAGAEVAGYYGDGDFAGRW